MTLIDHLEIKRNAIRESILHWERMIEWASRTPKSKPVDFVKMKFCLGEAPYAEDCALCRRSNKYCWFCPLHRTGELCALQGSAYELTINSQYMAREWIRSAKNHMIPALYACYELCL